MNVKGVRHPWIEGSRNHKGGGLFEFQTPPLPPDLVYKDLMKQGGGLGGCPSLGGWVKSLGPPFSQLRFGWVGLQSRTPPPL